MLDLIKRVGVVIIVGSFLVTLGISSVHAASNNNVYSLKVKTVNEGNIVVQPDLKTYPSGEVVTLTATPATTSWQIIVDGHAEERPGSQEIDVAITGDTLVKATFPSQQYSLKVKTVNEGNIVVQPDLKTYPSGEVVTLTATPATTSWQIIVNGHAEERPGSQTIDVTITGDTTVKAVFP